MTNFIIRKAKKEDSQTILNLINGIAKYEKMENEVVATKESIEKSIFDLNQAKVLIAEENNVPVGFALYFYNYSTFFGKANIYLEDIFVYEKYRKRGYGKKLFFEVVKIAKENNASRIDWLCLNWNKPAIDFYLKLGAKPMKNWTLFRLTENEINNLTKQ